MAWLLCLIVPFRKTEVGQWLVLILPDLTIMVHQVVQVTEAAVEAAAVSTALQAQEAFLAMVVTELMVRTTLL